MNFDLHDKNIQSLFIDISQVCNLRCVMCDVHSDEAIADYSAKKGKANKLMDIKLFKEIVDQASDFIKVYIPQGSGEPLLHPEFVGMLEYIRAKRPDANIWFNTNGLLLKPELTDKILKVGINLISFSIDAVSAEVYEKIRIGGDYNTLIRNIKYFLKARKRSSLKLKPQVGVTFVLQSLNKHQKKDFLKHWIRKVDQVVFYKKAELDRTRPELFFKPKCSRKPCESLWNMLGVAIDGTAVPCCGDVGKEEPLGNIKEQNLEDIIANGRHLELRQLHLANEYSKSDLCSKCDCWMAYEKYTCNFPSKGLYLTRNAFSECWQYRK